jgi:hypothetical protein
MAFNIRMGLPEMAALWNVLSTRKQQGKLDRDEERFFKKLAKALGYLGQNPRHNSLASHEIDDLTRNTGSKFSNRISKTTHRQPVGYSGRMARTRETSRCWPLSHIRRIKNAGLTSVLNCPLCHQQRQNHKRGIIPTIDNLR